MSQCVKTKRQANFEGFKGFGAFKGLVEQKKKTYLTYLKALVAHSCQKKSQFYTRTR
jgi:hypothetical protein